ncbi:MAG: chemotaxis protein CheW [Ilumatobacteraceae bacterium]
MSIPAVLFPVGEDRYAIATSAVREVVSDPRPTLLPRAPTVLLGAFNLRGEVIPMFDTAALLGIGNVTGTSSAVVVNTTAGPAALVVSGLPAFVVLDGEIGPSELHGTLGVYAVDDDVAVLLDVEAILVVAVNPDRTTAVDALVSA